jgi:outer membrane receptor for ferrienterochelin and colicins
MRPRILLLLLLSALSSMAQDSTQFRSDMDEVVITATRSARKLTNVAVPTALIGRKRIEQSGSLRLNDILAEQTGLFITQRFGKGVQMQGLNPDYTLILINGEPMIGRMSGVLDLSRISVGNISKVEIVKGPSSSLYGSEALAGVINIITEQPSADKLSATLRYGRFNTLDGSINGSFKRGKSSGSGFLNSNSSDGYSLLPFSAQKTVEPFRRFTQQYQAAYDISPKTRLSAMVRYHHENIRNSIAVSNLGQTILSYGREVNQDLNVNPVLAHRFNSKLKTSLRGYYTSFASEQQLDVKDQAGTYDDRFRQRFFRLENQTDITLGDAMSVNVGGGYIMENVRSNRYDTLGSVRTNTIGYLFLQHEWKPVQSLTLITGLRYDANRNYASVWSPKLALRYALSSRLALTGSVGRGFKAPDFRQLYLNFTNVAAGSYSVFGSLSARDEVERLRAAGQIDYLTPSYGKLQDLSPETSTGSNLGLQYQWKPGWSLKLNAFRNDVNHLIITDIIAYKKNGGQVFSYLNVSRAFTQGLEAEAAMAQGRFTYSLGYQFLVTADKDVLAQIRAGNVFTRDELTGASRRLQRHEYAGLPNRSGHMANAKLFYASKDARWQGSLRLLYQSRWGVNDVDGNGVINDNVTAEFARGFAQANLSAGRTFSKGLSVMIGVDNLFNYKDPVNLPGNPGRNGYVTVKYDLIHKHKP